ncbi:MAG: cysteine synthase A [Syntrophomonadaceae bacterium]|jgi:cysteine synthase A|nr:cysteine synthase A [Syntrophomonadaceae bacterium]
MKVVNSILELIGETPVIRLSSAHNTGAAQVYLKLEGFNPGGSIKDRPGLYMIEKAEEEGKLKPDSIILEATSGNTGIGLAMAASIKSYPLVIVMPENMSEERKKILRAYGAQLVLTPAEDGVPGAVRKAEQLSQEDSRYFPIKQFENPANAESHQVSTALEIYQQMEGKLDALVCGVGSGGTISGIAKTLKEKIPRVQIVAVEPAESAVLSGGSAGPHKIQGIGAGFVPLALNLELIDKIFPVESDLAIQTCRELAAKDAVLVGISSGAAVYAALHVARRMGKGAKVLAIAADGADKYMSTELFE